MSNENNSGILVLLSAVGGAVISAIGAALIMNTETGRKTDVQLSNAYKTVKNSLPQNKSTCIDDMRKSIISQDK